MRLITESGKKIGYRTIELLDYEEKERYEEYDADMEEVVAKVRVVVFAQMKESKRYPRRIGQMIPTVDLFEMTLLCDDLFFLHFDLNRRFDELGFLARNGEEYYDISVWKDQDLTAMIY